jgi:hypothetical protein
MEKERTHAFNFDDVNWGLIDRYFEFYGLHGMAQQHLEQTRKLVAGIRKDAAQLGFFGVVLGFSVSFIASLAVSVISRFGDAVLLGSLNAVALVAVVSAYLFLKRMAEIRVDEMQPEHQKERETVHRYFVEQILKGTNEGDLWRELSRRKYGGTRTE